MFLDELDQIYSTVLVFGITRFGSIFLAQGYEMNEVEMDNLKWMSRSKKKKDGIMYEIIAKKLRGKYAIKRNQGICVWDLRLFLISMTSSKK